MLFPQRTDKQMRNLSAFTCQTDDGSCPGQYSSSVVVCQHCERLQADMAESTIEEVDVHLRNIINSLYLLIMSIHDYQGAETLKSVTTEMYRFSTSPLGWWR